LSAARASLDCHSLSTYPRNRMTPDEMKRLATETLARLETDYDNPARMLEHLHDDAEWHAMVQPPGSSKWNKAEFAIMWRGIRQQGEAGMRIWPTGFVVEGNKVAMEAESYLKLKNGKEYRNQYHYLFEFRDGKIARVKEFMDTAYAFRMFEL
jgi:ketosteroid isomerase-like protein